MRTVFCSFVWRRSYERSTIAFFNTAIKFQISNMYADISKKFISTSKSHCGSCYKKRNNIFLKCAKNHRNRWNRSFWKKRFKNITNKHIYLIGSGHLKLNLFPKFPLRKYLLQLGSLWVLITFMFIAVYADKIAQGEDKAWTQSTRNESHHWCKENFRVSVTFSWFGWATLGSYKPIEPTSYPCEFPEEISPWEHRSRNPSWCALSCVKVFESVF